MNLIKLLIVFGTRPEAIKMAPIIKELQNSPEHFDVKVCVTAQHRDLLDQVLTLFQIVPDYDLNIMKHGQDLYDITSTVLLSLRSILNDTQPNAVIVHGDTTTSMAASLSAFYARIPVFHVEAGLRTNNIYSPWPEEINRQITSRISALNFAPTSLSEQNLIQENTDLSKIKVVGNSVIDALHMAISLIDRSEELQQNNKLCYLANGITSEMMDAWNNNDRRLVLITGHRRENFGDPFIQICEAIKDLSEKYPLVDFIYPVHPNPNVKKAINHVFGDDQSVKNRLFCQPIDYFPFVSLMNMAYVILTDSGGIQEEAPSLGKPVLVMRDTTERPEGIEAGTVKLVGTHKQNIMEELSHLLDNTLLYNSMKNAKNPYGDGKTAERIKNAILDYFCNLEKQ